MRMSSEQTADPSQFIMKEINEDTDQYQSRTGHDDPFPRFTTHTIELQITGNYK